QVPCLLHADRPSTDPSPANRRWSRLLSCRRRRDYQGEAVVTCPAGLPGAEPTAHQPPGPVVGNRCACAPGQAHRALTSVAAGDGMAGVSLSQQGACAMNPPKWLQELFSAVCHACACDVKGRLSGFSLRWSKPDGNPWGAWWLVLTPSVLEIAGGKEDGAMGFDCVDVDLLALPRCLDAVASFRYDPDYGENPHLTLEGKKGQRDVVIEVY